MAAYFALLGNLFFSLGQHILEGLLCCTVRAVSFSMALLYVFVVWIYHSFLIDV